MRLDELGQRLLVCPLNASLSSSRLKTGIRRIMRRIALHALMRLQRRTKPVTACGRIMRLNVWATDEENENSGTVFPETSSTDTILKFFTTFY